MNENLTVAQFMGAGVGCLDQVLGADLLAQPVPLAMRDDESDGGGQPFVLIGSVAVVPVRGVLMRADGFMSRAMRWQTFGGLIEVLAELAAADHVARIVLDMDSPGGVVVGLPDAAEAVRAAAAVKPVSVRVDGLAASAAYWIASQATEISAAPGSQLGSIGTMMIAGAPVAPDRDGVQEFVFRSAHANNKNAPPDTEAGRAAIQRELDVAEAMFHAAVAAGRGIDPGQLAARLSMTSDVADGGGSWWAAEAMARGLVDRVEGRAAFWAGVQSAATPSAPRGRGARALAQAARARASV
jgi:ClpP class serine protease